MHLLINIFHTGELDHLTGDVDTRDVSKTSIPECLANKTSTATKIKNVDFINRKSGQIALFQGHICDPFRIGVSNSFEHTLVVTGKVIIVFLSMAHVEKWGLFNHVQMGLRELTWPVEI